jgi:hypothetical protein
MTRYKRTGSATFFSVRSPKFFQNKLTQDTVGGALTDEYLSFSCLSAMRAAKLGTGPVAVKVRHASAPEASLVAPTRARPLLIPMCGKADERRRGTRH